MRANIFLWCSVVMISGCSLLPLIKGKSFQIKAVIDGEIKGTKIHCEKTIELADGKWGVMCSIGDDMDVKYRVRPMPDEDAHVEFVIGKTKRGRSKVIATPSLFVKNKERARTVSTSGTSTITILAERVR